MRKADFFVVGVVKGGTTALYNYLAQHPEVYLTRIKETNHFAKDDVQPEHFGKEYALDVRIDLAKYIAGGMREVVHIAHVNDDAQYAALYSKAKEQKALGEVSNSYAICPSAAARIRAYNPHAKLFIMLRDPVRRAWSQYLMNLREGKTSEKDFLREVHADHDRRPKGWGVNHQYLELGKYAGQIRRFRELFPQEQFHVLLYEDYVKDPAATMRQIFGTLGVDPQVPIDFSERHNSAAMPRHQALNSVLVKSGVLKTVKDLVPRGGREMFKRMLYSEDNVPKLDHQTANALWSEYATDVSELGDMLGKDLLTYWGPDHYGKR
jgi:Sulfotransferase family